jgi:hypothetical protein
MKIKLGKFTKADDLKVARKVNREIELEFSTGWTQKHKVHKSMKTYSRKDKHKVVNLPL